jgi:hypothetical protein
MSYLSFWAYSMMAWDSFSASRRFLTLPSMFNEWWYLLIIDHTFIIRLSLFNLNYYFINSLIKKNLISSSPKYAIFTKINRSLFLIVVRLSTEHYPCFSQKCLNKRKILTTSLNLRLKLALISAVNNFKLRKYKTC